MKKAKGDFEIRFSYQPWPFFLLFAAASAVLSYAPLSLSTKLFIGLFGIVVPFLLALKAVKGFSASSPLYEKETFDSIPPWILILVVVAAFGLRFYRLTDWALWPNTDEGLNGRFALDLARHWNGRFLYTFGQVPPLLIWLLSLAMPRVENPLVGLWAVPAAISFLAALLSYPVARIYFSKSFSFVFFLFWSFSFWPLYYGRFCHEGALLPLWALLVLGAFGFFLKASTPRAELGAAIALGAATGLGSFTFTPWPVLALWVFLLVGFVAFFRRAKKTRLFFGFGAAFLFLNIPFLRAIVQEGFGHHIWGVSAVRGYVPWQGQVTAWFSYLTTPFWGCFEAEPAYTAFWGGMLNPLMTAAFFIGFLETTLHRSRPGMRWAWAGALLCLLPGFMTLNVEMYRVILILPFLLAGAAIGVQRLLKETSSRGRNLALTGFVLLSLGLDLGNFHFPYRSVSSDEETLPRFHPAKPVHSFQAYRILKSLSEKSAGLYFSDFSVEPYDQTLAVAVDGFNALVNPHSGPPQWAALTVNVNYKPYLEKRFPGGKWVWLDSDAKEPNGGLMLAIIPLTSENRLTFEQWSKIHAYFKELDWNWLNLADGMKGEPLLVEFKKVEPLLTGESFLKALYWEKIAGLLYRDRGYPKDMQALQNAIQEGVPAAHLYYKLGSILLRKNEFVKAREALLKAQKAPLNLTLSAEAVKMLDEIEKQGGLPQS